MDKKVRLADIAQRLGISIVSVSKALSGQSGVSEETRAKVLDLAREMGYVPLRTKPENKQGVRSGNIGILVADRFFDDNTFYSDLYRHVLIGCTDHGFSALIEIVKPEAEQNCTIPSMIQGKKVDGLIFMGEIDRRYLDVMTHQGIPYILLDFYDENLDADSVTSDNVDGGYLLTNHLLETGRRDICFVGSILATSSIMDRFLGYTKALYRSGIPIRPEWILQDRDGNGQLIPLRLPAQMPQAFVCSCDAVAFNLVEQLQNMGCRVPDDVAVVGYDDYYYSQLSSPKLTTYRVNVAEMGRTAVNQLVRKLRGKHVSSGNTVINGRMVCRESTRG